MRRLAGGIAVVLLLALGQGGQAHEGAGFGYMVKNIALEFDPATVPAKHQAGYRLMVENCTRCHNQERIVRCLQDCYNQGLDYEKTLREVIGKKIRLAGSDVTREEGKNILEFLIAMYQIETREHALKH